ncbi:hypothetical protein [Mycoplasmopsis cricetuli]|uniref:hypothetical protein n=1 Tax=Mycoplasmopsis cricetuli TaxID=171283 RepID=UPI00046FC7CA|nr:hypothetical protein [Mycoplasmopsis cricetuli]
MTILNWAVVFFVFILVLILIIVIFWRTRIYFIEKRSKYYKDTINNISKKAILKLSNLQLENFTILFNILVKNNFSKKKKSLFNAILITNDCVYILSELFININDNNQFFLIDNKNIVNFIEQDKWIKANFDSLNYKFVILIDKKVKKNKIINKTNFDVLNFDDLENIIKSSNNKKINVNQVQKIFLSNNLNKIQERK